MDGLPIPVDEHVSAERFLSGLAFISARNRYDCAESLIGAAFGGTVLGAMARSLFTDGLRWLWIADDPQARRRALLGDLLQERHRICDLLATTGGHCPNLARWLMPVPAVADLTGESLNWVDAPSMPTDDALLDEFLTNSAVVTGLQHERARALLNVGGLRGAVLVLAHAGHGNYLGLQSSLADDGIPGHDLRADHEALFMHVAAAGAAATLFGVAAAVPDLWPTEVEPEPFLDEALRLATEVADAARGVHKLTTSRSLSFDAKPASATPPTGLLHPGAVMTADQVLPDGSTVVHVAAAAETFWETARSFKFDPWRHGNLTLHEILNLAGAHSNLEGVLATYNRPGSKVIAPFAARMLLEEAARLHWRFQVTGDDFKSRATQYFDEFRARKAKTINLLVGNGAPRADAESIFSHPPVVQTPDPHRKPTQNREPIPTVTLMLQDFGAKAAEPGWLRVAYSLLSQVTHATPLGYLHSIRARETEWEGNTLSTEMLALSLDVACTASAHLIGHSTLVLTDLAEGAVEYRGRLIASAARVHAVARLVHGLD
jgi:hypothetical protein